MHVAGRTQYVVHAFSTLKKKMFGDAQRVSSREKKIHKHSL